MSDAAPTASDFADCLCSGLSGMELSKALHHHFPALPRVGVYLGVALAVAILQADLTAAEMELTALRPRAAA